MLRFESFTFYFFQLIHVKYQKVKIKGIQYESESGSWVFF